MIRLTLSLAVQAAAQRMVEFWLGTFADPIYFGDWPASVKARIPFIPEITPDLVSLCPFTVRVGAICLQDTLGFSVSQTAV